MNTEKIFYQISMLAVGSVYGSALTLAVAYFLMTASVNINTRSDCIIISRPNGEIICVPQEVLREAEAHQKKELPKSLKPLVQPRPKTKSQ